VYLCVVLLTEPTPLSGLHRLARPEDLWLEPSAAPPRTLQDVSMRISRNICRSVLTMVCFAQRSTGYRLAQVGNHG